MPPIRVLSETLVNQIAAGEVIERPASVVKELLENALDAQAARIRIELAEAGKKLMRVSDDGAGIAAADVPRALASHATSKIASADDLEGITTLGFRGEALASIASVADLRIVSRTADALEAVEVSASAGKVEPPRPASGPVGTSVEVRNLFRYVPARRKFLKTDTTEMGHVSEHVARAALAYPAVHFTVTHNGRHVYELPPAENVRSRIGAFFGSDLAEVLLPVGGEEAAGTLRGLVAPPQVARATTKHQYLFINGRFVRDRSLLHALREAYRGMLEGGRQPVAFLFLTVPPDRVDVNVHPTKIEVRLRDAHLLYGLVLAAVRERLLGPGITPHAVPSAPPAEEEAGMERPHEDRVRRAVADFLRSPPTQERIDFRGRAARSSSSSSSAPPSTPPARADSRGPLPPPPEEATDEEGPPPVQAIQIHNTYLVAETTDGMLIVDQHALHERVLFEEIMARLEAGTLESQRRLMPVAVDLSDREMAAVEAHEEALERLGIEVAPLGPRAVGVQAFPSLLAKADPEGTLRDFLAWVLELDAAPAPRQVLEKLAHVAACRAAVKAGDPLEAGEIRALLAHREAARLAATCPHGRPTALMLSRSDLERQFGRDYAAPGRGEDETALPF